jgi:hypothetical protein
LLTLERDESGLAPAAVAANTLQGKTTVLNYVFTAAQRAIMAREVRERAPRHTPRGDT